MRKLAIRTAMLASILALGATAQGQSIRAVGHSAAQGRSAAVIADDVTLVYTGQLLPVTGGGQIAAAGDASGQLERLMSRLDEVLSEAGSKRSLVVKLNFYLASEELQEVIERGLAKHFTGEYAPAVSSVVTPLRPKDALLSLDAVAVSSARSEAERVERMDNAAVMPAGSRIYVAGQAEPGTMQQATRKTLESLQATLMHCGRSDADIVQLKAFLSPMESADQVLAEIKHHFAPSPPPPVVLVEWQSNSPIEIELVAWGGPSNAEAPQLEFITPPGMQASPVYSRVARIHRGGTIFFSDMYGPSTSSAAEELHLAFELLRKLTGQCGSDLQHLVKATYYVTDAEMSRAHNEIRPKYYDPQRPPAASKAVVAGTGRQGRRYVMDMIAVPRP